MTFEADFKVEEPTCSEVDAYQGLVIIEFGAEWCPHCQTLAPLLRRFIADRDNIRHIKIADGKGKRLGLTFRVKLWPSLIFLRDGQLVQQIARPSEAELQSALQRLSRLNLDA